jgi:hypothetical protein
MKLNGKRELPVYPDEVPLTLENISTKRRTEKLFLTLVRRLLQIQTGRIN